MDCPAMNRPMHVTDHALIRWLERVEGLDVEALRQRIAARAARCHAAATQMSVNPDYVVKGDGIRLVVRGAVIVTVLIEGEDRP
jgi:hypothetical protein